MWHSPDEVPSGLGRTAITIGVFDGVHRGHQAVIRTTAQRAVGLGVPAVVVTFDPNPLAVVRPEVAPLELTPIGLRVRLLHAAGADHVLVLPFGRDRSEQSPEDFVDDIVVGVLRAAVVVVGADFRFGHRAAGTVELLRELGRSRGFDVETVAPVGDTEVQRWSSTEIRRLIADGEVAAAAAALGRPYPVQGVVVHGDQRGRALGFPTANVPVHDHDLVPADGVYAGWLTRDGRDRRLPAALSVGTNPTFDGVERRVEAHILDRDDLDLYGVPVTIEFVDRIRGMRRFDSTDDLVATMRGDVKRAREILDRRTAPN